MKDGKKKMKSETIRYKKIDGTIAEKPLPSGVIRDADGNLTFDPRRDTDPAPNVSDQIGHLIGFIEYFKDTMTPKQITDLVRFMTFTITGGNAERFKELIAEINRAQISEEHEAAQIATGNPEDLPHNGYMLLKMALNDLRDLTPAQFEEQIDNVRHFNPQNFQMLITKVSTRLFDGKTDFTEETGVKVGTVKRKPVIVTVQAYVAIDDAILPPGLTPFDGEVLNGICSIWATGQSIMTSRQIHEAFAGKGTTSPQAISRVTRSINKLRSTILSMDWTEHARIKGLPLENPDDYITTKDNLLLMKNVNVRMNGFETNAFQLLAEPILYTYGKATGQIVTVDKEYQNLNMESNTEKTVIIRNYLLRRIELMKNPRNKVKSNIILFETLFDECGITGSKVEIKRDRDSVFATLDSLKGKGYIKGYTVLKTGQRFDGVAIDFTPKKQERIAGKN